MLMRLACAVSISTIASAQTTVLLDDFASGPVSLTAFSNGQPPLLSVGGNYDAPTAVGGRRSISMLSSFMTTSLTVDTAAQQLRLDTDGVGQFFLAYGMVSNNGMGVQASDEHRLNLDWSDVEAIRFHLSRNDVRMSISSQAGTRRPASDPGGENFGFSLAPETFIEDGFTGAFDLPLDAFADGGLFGPVDWGDVDYFWFSIASRFQDSDFTIESIELVMTGNPADLNGDGSVDGTDLAILLAAWGGAEIDLNGNGITDSGDLAILLAAWGS